MPIKLYIFDMGGVVVRDCNVFPEVYEYLRVGKAKFEELCGPNFRLLSDGKMTVSEFWRLFSQNYGSPIERDLFAEFFHPVVDSEVVAKINELKRKARVVCGTNTIECHYRYHREHGEYDIFDKVYASNEIGFSKPDPDFYRYIIREERVNAGESCFIDDLEENVAAAARLGIKTIHFTGKEALKEVG
jgi:putative hydrolase of the HAD superfamily